MDSGFYSDDGAVAAVADDVLKETKTSAGRRRDWAGRLRRPRQTAWGCRQRKLEKTKKRMIRYPNKCCAIFSLMGPDLIAHFNVPKTKLKRPLN